LTLEVGQRLIEAAVAADLYHRRRFASPLSMTFRIRLFETPIVHEAVGRFHSYIQNTEIIGSLGPRSFHWKVMKGRRSCEMYWALPDQAPGAELGFSLAYDDRASRLHAVSAAGTDEVSNWHLGELRTDIRFDLGARNPYFKRRAVYFHDRLLEPQDLDR